MLVVAVASVADAFRTDWQMFAAALEQELTQAMMSQVSTHTTVMAVVAVKLVQVDSSLVLAPKAFVKVVAY